MEAVSFGHHYAYAPERMAFEGSPAMGGGGGASVEERVVITARESLLRHYIHLAGRPKVRLGARPMRHARACARAHGPMDLDACACVRV